ncbi:Aste57867_18304 [Aphanomyces stellatus]|uniref:Aste57867_18304 protein n=1 Tax=Aphanomyces stellatus TaxID=120398 RepID=A0A485L9R2_9STRA|nr:hypothetical protein As57867_018242 [Aphanomyces stellatus]VFT95040.1 Aste57867_18304 [Aphanomyces stellatus]
MFLAQVLRRSITIKSTRLTPEEITTKTKRHFKPRALPKASTTSTTKLKAAPVKLTPADDAFAPMRLAKRLAMAGVSSRRDAEKIILEGRVLVNGAPTTNVATNVTMRDLISVDEKPLSARPTKRRVWMAHKLAGELVTTHDPQGRPTIMDRIKRMGIQSHLMAGRLDFNTEGLLLLTNDGDYARQLEHPKYEVTRVYRVLVRGQVLPSKIEELQRGALVDGIKYRPMQVKIESTKDKDSWLQIKLTEGKNREIRKAMAHVRLIVKRLVRVEYGPYRLADLTKGHVLEVHPKKSLD